MQSYYNIRKKKKDFWKLSIPSYSLHFISASETKTEYTSYLNSERKQKLRIYCKHYVNVKVLLVTINFE